MLSLLSFLLRALLLVTGLVVAAGLAVAFVVLLSVWALRAGWARITGRPATPFVVRFGPRRGFASVFRPGESAAAATTDPMRPSRLRSADVTDVEPKSIRP